MLCIGLGDTDEHAHGGRYDRYLRAAHSADENLKRLWEELQSRPQYRDSTSIIMTTDHGRGDAPVEWKSHGAKVKGSEAIVIGVLGPDTPALGERKGTTLVTQGQVAATIAALLGEDYVAETPAATRPIVEAIRPAGGGRPFPPSRSRTSLSEHLRRALRRRRPSPGNARFAS